MTDKPKRPRDANQLAHMIVGIATGEIDDAQPEKAEGQRKGGLKGGKARSKALSSEKRSEIATNAANARWKNRK
ncbi:histone H1 [Roseovarius sp. Pro17]|uniref:histone H1 n=1 Tax=Roseovarius sp. Pro17 TaxID=3108175 RepID=UPI002D765D81|nr:histone H1 [Roseovarius sp. Pro17]